MAYIGTPVQQALTKVTSQSFNGTGSQTVFTLNRAVNTGEELEVFVNNVQQEPGVGKSYTATGTTLTFDAAPSSGTGNIYVIYRGIAEVTRRLEHDPNQALAATTGTFSGDLTVDTNTLYVDSTNNRVGIGTSSPSDALTVSTSAVNGGVTVSGSTDPQYFLNSSGGNQARFKINDASSMIQTGSWTNIPVGFYTNGSERMRIDSSGRVTMPYQPSFLAGGLSVKQTTDTSVLFNSTGGTGGHNTGNHFNTSTGQFTCPVTGRYFFSFNLLSDDTRQNYFYAHLRKNGSVVKFTQEIKSNSTTSGATISTSMVVDCAANDVVDVFGYGSSVNIHASNQYTWFSGYLVA
jgi:hypothetical protein